MNWITLTEGVAWLDFGLLILISILGLLWYAKRPLGLRYLILWLWSVTLIEIVAKYLAYVLYVDNVILLHLLTLLEFVLLTLFYREVLSLSAQGRRSMLIYVIATGSAITLYSAAFWIWKGAFDGKDFQLYSKVLVNGSIVACAATYFIRVLLYPNRFAQGSAALLRINSGLFLYYAGSFFIFVVIGYLLKESMDQSIHFWFLNALLTLVLHLLCLSGLWQRKT